jgi:actin related protein 2/3 complex subunit 5
MAQSNWRLIDVDALDPENAFPAELLTPQFTPILLAHVQALATQCRQALQRGEQEDALQSTLQNVPYGGDDQCKVRAPLVHMVSY